MGNVNGLPHARAHTHTHTHARARTRTHILPCTRLADGISDMHADTWQKTSYWSCPGDPHSNVELHFCRSAATLVPSGRRTNAHTYIHCHIDATCTHRVSLRLWHTYFHCRTRAQACKHMHICKHRQSHCHRNLQSPINTVSHCRAHPATEPDNAKSHTIRHATTPQTHVHIASGCPWNCHHASPHIHTSSGCHYRCHTAAYTLSLPHMLM